MERHKHSGCGNFCASRQSDRPDLAWRNAFKISFDGPAETLNRTDVSQPALYTCAIASFHAMQDRPDAPTISACAGLSLGEYTALHLAGAFSFEDGLRLVATRGKLMQAAAEASRGGMVALIGADEAQAQAVCDGAAQGEVLVCANFNAPGQIVLSGHASACDRALEFASTVGCRATRLQVAGAFHSPLMASAAELMQKRLKTLISSHSNIRFGAMSPRGHMMQTILFY